MISNDMALVSWFYKIYNDVVCVFMSSHDFNKNNCVFKHFILCNMNSYDFIWFPMIWYDYVIFLMFHNDSRWYHMMLHDVVGCQMISHDFTKSTEILCNVKYIIWNHMQSNAFMHEILNNSFEIMRNQLKS